MRLYAEILPCSELRNSTYESELLVRSSNCGERKAAKDLATQHKEKNGRRIA